MPTYYSPPPTPLTSSSSSSRFPSRSNSFSTSTSTSTGRNSRLSKLGHSKDEEAATKKKIPYFFLGSIAAAALVAHKCWPKGYIHGDKEDWELSELALRAKHRRLAENAAKSAHRGGRLDRRSSEDAYELGYGLDNRVNPRGGYREDGRGRRRGGYYVGEGDGYHYSRDDRGLDWGRGRERRGPVIYPGHRSRSHDRDWDYGLDTYVEPSSYTSATGRECIHLPTDTERYYPPASRRYLFEQSMSTYLRDKTSSNAGLAAESRISSSSQHAYDDHDRGSPSQAMYVYRDLPARFRRASVDGGRVRRDDEGHGWAER